VVCQGDEKIFSLRDLKKEGDGKQKGEDDKPAEHQTLHKF
jgi:hypothetical protein